jgi:hypothetical protein
MIMSACWPLQGMSVTQKAVLISLADNANDQGVCWPSIPTIGKRCCLSDRAVQNAIKWLEQAGIVTANRNNGRHTSYTLTPAQYSPPQDIHPRTKCTGAPDAPPHAVHPTPASPAGDPRTACTTPPHQVPSNRKEPSEEPSLNRQPARRAPRVALHGELRSIELPDCIDREAWLDWCEHREAKATAAGKAVPWTHAAGRVSVKKLTKIHADGGSVTAAIEEAVLRGWTGLWEAKEDPAASGKSGTSVPDEWWRTTSGVEARGKQLGVKQKDGEVFMRYKARVVKAAGPGEWMEDMLRDAARFGDEQYEALYAWFNDIPRDQLAQREAV